METKPLNKYFAELFGTFVLVFLGTGSAVLAGTNIHYVGIAFVFGLSVLMMAYTIGPISGCHINPAVTISMLVAKKINGKDALGYIIAQIVGAIIASGLLLVIAKGIPGYSLAENGLGQNGYGNFSPGKYDMVSVLIAEVVLTFIFLMVIFGATAKNAAQGFAGLAIGLSLTAIHLVGIPVSGVSVNPARSIGPALFVGAEALQQLWLFIVAPIAGGILAALTWKALSKE